MSAVDVISIGELARRACLMEVCAPKAGNVHPAARFTDVTHIDFITSANAIAPILARALSRSIGATILDCVHATQKAVGCNTNLGIILLLAPLCAVPLHEPLATGIHRVLDALTLDDAARAYEAIRLAKPGGLGNAHAEDVHAVPTISLKQAMGLAAERDAIARQYAHDFTDVIRCIASDLAEGSSQASPVVGERIVHAHLKQMAREPDTLIMRKCGIEVATQSSRMARQVLDAGWPGTRQGRELFATFDAWLRSDGHRRNPGTTADLIAAGLFVAMREKQLSADIQWLAEWAT